MSTTLMLGMQRGPTELPDENVVRRTTFPVNPADKPAMATDAPEPEEVETDENPNLGFVNRQVASKWNPSRKFAPFWRGTAQARHNEIVNERVASDGLSPSLEASGVFGHGTAAYAEGIEHVGDLGSWGGFGNEYFEIDKRGANPTGGNFMSPTPDLEGTKFNAAQATRVARDSYQASSAYALFYRNTVGERA